MMWSNTHYTIQFLTDEDGWESVYRTMGECMIANANHFGDSARIGFQIAIIHYVYTTIAVHGREVQMMASHKQYWETLMKLSGLRLLSFNSEVTSDTRIKYNALKNLYSIDQLPITFGSSEPDGCHSTLSYASE